MKEFWTYQATHLSNGRKMFKKLKKSQHLATYKAIVREFLANAQWMEQPAPAGSESAGGNPTG
jgi:hypothetical protein